MTADEYGRKVHDARELTPCINQDGLDLKQLLFDEFEVLDIQTDIQEKALGLFSEFYKNYPRWAAETVGGLPLTMLPLDILSQNGAIDEISELPDLGSVMVADLLSDIGKLCVNDRYPDVIEASYHKPDLWDRTKARKMRAHVYLGRKLAQEEGLAEDICFGIVSHHSFGETAYGPRRNLSKSEAIMAKTLANTDYAMAAANRVDKKTPRGGEVEIRANIVTNSLRLFTGLAPVEIARDIAEQTADFAITTARQLGSRALKAVS